MFSTSVSSCFNERVGVPGRAKRGDCKDIAMMREESEQESRREKREREEGGKGMTILSSLRSFELERLTLEVL